MDSDGCKGRQVLSRIISLGDLSALNISRLRSEVGPTLREHVLSLICGKELETHSLDLLFIQISFLKMVGGCTYSLAKDIGSMLQINLTID